MRYTLKLLIILGVSASLNAMSPAEAHARLDCRPTPPKLSVKTTTARTKYVRTKSAKDLTQMHGHKRSHSKSSVGGLGGGEIGFKTETRFEISSLGSKSCVKLTNVDVTFFAKPEIHIANNFSRSSCEYNAVIAHEQEHIRILRKFVREYSPKVKTELQRIARGVDPAIGPVRESEVKKAQNSLQKQFTDQISAYSKKILKVLEKRQDAFDSPEEYERVASKCRKWDEKLFNN
ncbi:MAG: hypothetical protein AAF204_00955 [Pseudomonadota bacterium]